MPKKKKPKIKRIKKTKPVKARKISAKKAKPKIKKAKVKTKKKKIAVKTLKKKTKESIERKKIAKKKRIAKKAKKVAKPKKILKIKKTIALKSKSRQKLKRPVKTKKIARKKAVAKKIKIRRPKKIKQKVVLKENKMQVPKSLVQEFPAETLFKARIKVVGIGGGGGSIVSEIGRSLKKATFVIADTDIRALRKRPGIKYFWFGEELTHGLGTGVNVDLAKQAAEGAKEEISDIFKGQDIIVFIASLGGGLGSGATQVFAEAVKKFGGISFGIFTLPFKFEGKNKARIAQNALKSLRRSLNVSLTIPNEKIFKIISADTPITEAFSIVNKSLIESLESLIDLIYNPGIINIDFADLRTILKGRGNSAFLNTVEESGKDRADKICKKILINPLLQNNNFAAEKILFNISGAENLSMFEVEKISRHIGEQNPKAKIIFGISKNSKLKNKIKTTILTTGGGIRAEVPIKKTEPVKIRIEEPFKKESAVPEQKPESKKPKGKKKKPISKKPAQKTKEREREQKPVSFIPAFEASTPAVSGLDQRRMSVVETVSLPAKKAIRRSGLEVKRAEEQEEKKRMAQEKEWEIPAFLRRVKFNK